MKTVNVRLEASLVSLALAHFQTHHLAGQTVGEQPVTAENLQSALCDEVDMLYLVCPSALRLEARRQGCTCFWKMSQRAPQALPSERCCRS